MFARLALLLISASLISAQVSLAQSHGFETRAELEKQLSEANLKHETRNVILIGLRLNRGDFQDGDRIVVSITGPAGLSDTLTVRSGKRLELPQMGEISLEGTLRSELAQQITKHVSLYLRDPVVQATPLVRVGILGSVVRPGYYYTPADIPFSDVLMAAGGPTSDADIGKVTVRRDRKVIIDEDNTRVALTDGLSIDFLHMRAGDEITVGKENHFNWPVLLSSGTALIGVLFALIRR